MSFGASSAPATNKNLISLFGVIVKVELKLTTNVNLIEKLKYVPLKEYIDYFKQEVKNNKEIRMHFYRLSTGSINMLSDGQAVNYTLDQDHQEPGFAPNYKLRKTTR